MSQEVKDVELYSALAAEGASDGVLVIGIDEVGRGSLAGPLSVAAVALPLTPIISGLDDSKKLSAKCRSQLAVEIEQNALAIGIAHIDAAKIDKVGIGVALRSAMIKALKASGVEPDIVLIDGNPVNIHPKEKCIVKGDSKVACIAAASIVAKVTRDKMMTEFSVDYPEYQWASNKGYGSAAHIAAIQEYGPSPLHRRSFLRNILQEQSF